MLAETIDTGATVCVLQQVGPPEVAELDSVPGNAKVVHQARGFWEVVRSVTVELVTDNTVAARLVRLALFAGGPTPFLELVAPFPVNASKTARITFAGDAAAAGAANGPSIVAPLPELVLVPGYTLEVDVIAGVAGDAVQAGSLYREQYRLISVERE